MKHKLSLIVFATLLAAFFWHWQTGAGQSAGAATSEIVVLDQQDRPVQELNDGNTIRLQVKLPENVNEDTMVGFHLDGMDTPVAACLVKQAQQTCTSDRLAALGWFWDSDGAAQPQRTIQALVNGEAIAAFILKITPRPVVMVHGFLSNWQAWEKYLGPQGYLASIGLHGYAVGDGQIEGALNTGRIDNPTGHTNTIAQNAAILQKYIAQVKAETGAERVDLLVHSMGGMIARYYIDRLAQDDVTQLIILGTPMAGSDCANLPASLGFYLPAALEIQPSYMVNIFNAQITHRRGVPFFALAGTPILEPLKSPCTAIPSDIAVSFASATAIPLDIVQLPILHTELNTSDRVFKEFVAPHLTAGPGDIPRVDDPAQGAVGVQTMQFSRVFTGRVLPGESTEVVVIIDPGVTLAGFALYDPSLSLENEVRGASGNVIVLDTEKNGLARVEDPAALFHLGYGFVNPKPGAWKVTLTATDRTPATGAYYALTASYEGGAVLQANASILLPLINQSVEITARLEGADGTKLSLSTAQATIFGPGETPETITLSPVADDEWSAEWKPPESGLYSVEVQVSGKDADGNGVERATFVALEAQPAADTGQRNLLTGGALFILLVVLWWQVQRRRRRAR